MNRFFKIVLVLSVFLLVQERSSAQEKEHDLKSWTGIGLDMDWTKKWSSSLNVQMRRDNNLYDHAVSFLDFQVSRKLKKNIFIRANYRYGVSDVLPVTDFSHRYNVDLLLKKPRKWLVKTKKRTNYSLRLRAQREIPYRNNLQRLGKTTFRTKLKVQHNLKGIKIDPFLSAEFFYSLGEPLYQFNEDPERISYFNKYRLTGGLEWRLKKSKAINLSYMLNSRPGDDQIDHVFAVVYAQRIINKPFKKKKEK